MRKVSLAQLSLPLTHCDCDCADSLFRLRIAIVTETYPPEINGVAMTIARMVDGLLEMGHHVQMVRPRQHRDDQAQQRERYTEVLARGIPLPRYPGLKMGLPAERKLLKLWSEVRPDLVHIVTEGPLGWSALRTARRLQLPVVSDFHTNFHQYSRDYGFGWLHKPIAGYLRNFHNKGDATLVPTQAMRDDLIAEGYTAVRVVSRGVDTLLYNPGRRSVALRASWGLQGDAPVAIYVGRLAPEKNLPLVLHTFEQLAAVAPQARLVLVGDGPSRAELQRRYPQHVFAGMRTGEDLATHYASGDLFLFPSLTETFGNVTTEAMASGLAVIAYDYAAAGQLIVDGENGFVAPCGNEQAFAQAALRALGEPLRRTAARQRARLTAERLSWRNVVRDFAGVLHEIVASHEKQENLRSAAVLTAE